MSAEQRHEYQASQFEIHPWLKDPAQKLDAHLNELASDGWELVSGNAYQWTSKEGAIAESVAEPHFRQTHVFYWRRLWPEATA